MSRKKCCRCRCKCECKCKSKKHDCCSQQSRNTSCSGFNACTTLPTLLILCQSGLLCNDRAYILFLLFWLCGGVNANSCGYECC
ncbi:hypothetical protein P5E64_10820 [Clostridium perfringens]|nr:hypothetical protein [Clostridium perfringens]